MKFDFEDVYNKEKTKSNPVSVPLTNFKPGLIRIFRHVFKGMIPMEVERRNITENQSTIQFNHDFVGIVVGSPKNETKKYHIEYVGYPEQDVKYFQEREKLKNKK